MEYFDWYALTPSLIIDEKALQTAYYQKSKEFHPDFYIDAPAEEQARIMHLSVLNTKAYDVLRNFDSRLKYILEQKGLVTDGEKHNLSPAFLMEMMDINEQIASATAPGDEAAIVQSHNEIDKLDTQLKAGIAPILEKNSVVQLNEADWKALVDYHYKQRYVWRLKALLNKEEDM